MQRTNLFFCVLELFIYNTLSIFSFPFNHDKLILQKKNLNKYNKIKIQHVYSLIQEYIKVKFYYEYEWICDAVSGWVIHRSDGLTRNCTCFISDNNTKI